MRQLPRSLTPLPDTFASVAGALRDLRRGACHEAREALDVPIPPGRVRAAGLVGADAVPRGQQGINPASGRRGAGARHQVAAMLNLHSDMPGVLTSSGGRVFRSVNAADALAEATRFTGIAEPASAAVAEKEIAREEAAAAKAMAAATASLEKRALRKAAAKNKPRPVKQKKATSTSNPEDSPASGPGDPGGGPPERLHGESPSPPSPPGMPTGPVMGAAASPLQCAREESPPAPPEPCVECTPRSALQRLRARARARSAVRRRRLGAMQPGLAALRSWARGRRHCHDADADEQPAGAPQLERGPADILFENPVSHLRVLEGLARCKLHPALRSGLLKGEAATPMPGAATGDENDAGTSHHGLCLIQGPPGTGKTRSVVEELRRLLCSSTLTGPRRAKRILITCVTNQGVDNCYRAAVAAGVIADGQPRRGLTVLYATAVGREQGLHAPSVQLRGMQGRLVVFATTAARNGPRLADVSFDVIILDEAGLAPDSVTFGLLRQETHSLVLIGDHAQLRCVASRTGHDLHHARSTMERVAGLGHAALLLSVQHRMAPAMGALVGDLFYGGALSTAPRGPEDARLDAAWSPCLSRVDTGDGGGRAVAAGTSWCNPHEAEAVAALLASWPADAAAGSVAVLVPYAAQVAVVERALQGARSAGRLRGAVVEVLTVDASQGREWPRVVVCTVRDDGLGFFAEDARTLVALSRARHATVVVGACTAWRGGCAAWRRIAEAPMRCGGPMQKDGYLVH